MDCCVSASTWTHIDLASEARSWRGTGWRMVEAQHQVATMQLVDHNLDNQRLLEEILEESKPPLPPEAQGLPWLLSTPFRYPPPPGGSRFRGPDDPGVFYGAEQKITACAEAGYWRLRFWRDSEALRTRSLSMPVTLFRFQATAKRLLDLCAAPFSEFAALLSDPQDYTHTQALARHARETDIEALRYASARQPGGNCLAVFSPEVFRGRGSALKEQETWTLYINAPERVVFQRDLSRESFEFKFAK